MDANSWAIVAAGITIVVSAAAAVFAWVQARAAVDTLEEARIARNEARTSAVESARSAGEANAALVRQAEAQEEANQLRREALAPKDWSDPKAEGGSKWRIANTSSGSIFILGLSASPESAEGAVRIHTQHKDGWYDVGDSFVFALVPEGGEVRPEKFTISYRRRTDPEDYRRDMHFGL